MPISFKLSMFSRRNTAINLEPVAKLLLVDVLSFSGHITLMWHKERIIINVLPTWSRRQMKPSYYFSGTLWQSFTYFYSPWHLCGADTLTRSKGSTRSYSFVFHDVYASYRPLPRLVLLQADGGNKHRSRTQGAIFFSKKNVKSTRDFNHGFQGYYWT